MKTVTAMRKTGFENRHETGPRLIVKLKGQVIAEHRLLNESTTLGRAPDSDVIIDNKYVSGTHAMIGLDKFGAFIVDLASRNKTLVNGSSVSKAQLYDGDVISLGYHRVEYREGSLRSDQAEVNGGSVNTSDDDFRAFVDAFNLDAKIIAVPPEPDNREENEAGIDDPDVVEDSETTLISIDEAVSELMQAEPPGEEEDDVEEVHIVDDVEAVEHIELNQQAVETAIVENCSATPGELIDGLYDTFAHSETGLAAILAELFDFDTVSSAELMQYQPNFEALDVATARDRSCILVNHDGQQLAVFSNPFDQDLRPWVESRFPQALRWVLVSPGDINAFVSRHEQSMKAMDSAISVGGAADENGVELEDLTLASISQDSSPVVKLVHSTLYDALKAGASDIHMESGNAALEIRYRIDGVLAHVATVSGRDVAEQVISRIKVMSELDIAERRIPQDGRFKSAYEGRPIDFRVSIMPSSFGEDAVLRVLDKQAVTDQMSDLSLDSLGFESGIVESLRKLSERPYGMLLVTGPTGSGKTTTLYGAISESNSGLGKIVTIEDPVEYQLPGVLQIPVNEKKGLTFARGLRSILRHDPDKIMVGEIRDPDTAQIAIQSALTGHLVFTTVHANNVFDVLSRFLHMGVDAYSFVSALNGILAQRLLRIICENCGHSIEPTTAMLESTGAAMDVAREYNWRAGRGCSECRGTGYRGRKAVGELLVLNDELREAIIGRVPVRQLKEMAQNGGVQFIRTAAMNLLRDGLTTIEEVDRVTTMA